MLNHYMVCVQSHDKTVVIHFLSLGFRFFSSLLQRAFKQTEIGYIMHRCWTNIIGIQWNFSTDRLLTLYL